MLRAAVLLLHNRPNQRELQQWHQESEWRGEPEDALATTAVSGHRKGWIPDPSRIKAAISRVPVWALGLAMTPFRVRVPGRSRPILMVYLPSA